MNNHFQVFIIGGGNAGISVAAQLLIKDPNLDIAIIESSEKHYCQPACTLVGGGEFDVEDTIRNESDVMLENVQWIRDQVVAFEPENNLVKTENSGDFTYDYMVVSPGIQLNWHWVEGRKPWGKQRMQ